MFTMENKTITYSSDFKITHGFNLYGYEEINFNESKRNILNQFKFKYELKLKELLKKIGLKYISLNYYSPKSYNYGGDNLDLNIKLINKELFKKAILKHKIKIENALNENISYDGYIPLTIENCKKELQNLKNNSDYEPDILVLMTIINNEMDFSDFDITGCFIFEDFERYQIEQEIKDLKEGEEKFECGYCGCYFWVEDRNNFDCPNCEDKKEDK